MTTTPTFKHDDAYANTVNYFHNDELAADVFIQKYALRNSDGELLENTPVMMHERLAREFARIEARYPNPLTFNEIFSYFADTGVPHDKVNKFTEEELIALDKGMGEIIPQGSPMSAIGNPVKVQSLSNCFVIPSPEDSYGGILYTDQQQAQIMKRRGGVGFDVSNIRPKGLATSNAANTTDGISVFLSRFSNTCREVGQGGRRGALMMTIDVRHPEIETFINIKRDTKAVTGANISIRFNDEFMRCVENDSDYTLQWPVNVPLSEAIYTRVVRAKEIWDKFIDSTWQSAEPGGLFWDTIKRNTPSDAYESLGYGTISTNPCAELLLPAYDSCRLLVLNTAKFVKNQFGNDAYFDYEAFGHSAYIAQRLMDDLVDLELEAVDKILKKIEADCEPAHIKRNEIELWQNIREAAANCRRTGTGITGLGDTIAYLGFRYGGEQSISLTEKIYKSLALSAWKSSIDMAEQRGAFSIYNAELEKGHPFIDKIKANLPSEYLIKFIKYGRRNIALTTTAPTGSVSILTQTTGGIEPVFQRSYKRRRKVSDDAERVDYVDAMGDKWQEYSVYHHGISLWKKYAFENGLSGLVEESPYANSASNEIDWVASISLQAAAQKWICHAISKTCNLPKDATKEIVNSVYLTAWKSGCKGFTIYREGSRSGVLVSNDNTEQPILKQENHAIKRPKSIPCDIHKITVSSGDDVETYSVIIGKVDDQPYEVFCGKTDKVTLPKNVNSGKLIKKKNKGKNRYNLHMKIDDADIMFSDIVNLFNNPVYGAITRIISLGLRHNVPINYTVEQLQKDKDSDLFSFSKAIARVLKNYIPNGTKPTQKTCNACGSSELSFVEGCITCMSCGHSKCG